MNQEIVFRTSCDRCGECCGKGGPALHEEDLALVSGGRLPLADLVTLRQGEAVIDNVGGGKICLPSEIIKIKPKSGMAACLYFDQADNRCGIYENRPLECRTLECWNSAALAGIYDKARLTRAAILKPVSWMLEMVNAHEAECALDVVGDLVCRREAGDGSAAVLLSKKVNYDLHFRALAMEKGGLPADRMAFLFGRPLAEIISLQFRVKVIRA